MINPIKCPHCNEEVNLSLTCDEYFFDEEEYTAQWEGWCLNCQRSFSFTEIYKLEKREYSIKGE